MKYSATLFGLLAALPAAHGIAFGGPVPTTTSLDHALDETNPKPTRRPLVSELRKRQTNLFPETCGWVNGDYSSGVTCSTGRTCMLYTSASVGMAGCCAGSDTQVCGWSHSCIDYSAYEAGDCGTNCMLNDFVLKCTEVLRPYCVTWSYPGDDVTGFGCAATSTNTIYTVVHRATDGLGDTTSIALPTLSGNVVTGFNDASSGAAQPTNVPSGGGGSGTRTTKKIAIGLLVGIVLVVLFVVFVIIVGIIFCLKKKKKQRELAANAQAVATAQANRPQSMYPPPQQQQPPMQMQQAPPPMPQRGGFVPPMSPQSPQSTINGYFPPSGQNEQKYNPHTSVHEYAVTPISNPPTPAPAYSQPFGSPIVPPVPTVQAHYHAPADGIHEVDASGVSPPPIQQAAPPSRQYQASAVGAHEVDTTSVLHASSHLGPVYEIGQGR